MELEDRLKRMESLLQVAMDGGRIKKRGDMKEVSSFSVLDLRQSERVTQVELEEHQIAEPAWKRVAPTYNSPISQPLTSTKFQRLFDTAEQNPTLIHTPAVMASETPSPIWKGSLVSDVFSRRVFRELPSKTFALVLIDEAFKGFNSIFPVFDQNSFMNQVNEGYSKSGPSDPGWWASINVVLALAHRLRAMRTLETARENGAACGYMQNALAMVSELTMLYNSLPAVQALLGMTIILLGTPNPRLCSVLIAAAMRLAQTMGLHRKSNESSILESEIEQRKRVFWVAYFLDKDISLRTGQPPSQNDDDMDVELPSHNLSDIHVGGNVINTTNFFNCRIGLGIIQGQVYKRLYSAKALRQSVEEQLLAERELDAMLATWRNSVPIDFEEDTLTTLQPPIPPALVHKIIMRFTYVSCLITIHRPFPQNVSATSQTDDFCVIEARKAVRLIEITPLGDYACAW